MWWWGGSYPSCHVSFYDRCIPFFLFHFSVERVSGVVVQVLSFGYGPTRDTWVRGSGGVVVRLWVPGSQHRRGHVPLRWCWGLRTYRGSLGPRSVWGSGPTGNTWILSQGMVSEFAVQIGTSVFEVQVWTSEFEVISETSGSEVRPTTPESTIRTEGWLGPGSGGVDSYCRRLISHLGWFTGCILETYPIDDFGQSFLRFFTDQEVYVSVVPVILVFISLLLL